MKRPSRLPYFLGALLMCVCSSGLAQLVEAPVEVKVEYVPRKATVASVKTLTTAQVLTKLGFNSGSLVCVADGADARAPWSLKVKTVQGPKTSYTDLSGKVEWESLGESLVGAVKNVSSVAPAKTVSLGKPQSTQTVKAGIALSATEGFDFYGTVVTAYTVTQEAGKKVATWMPGACTAKMAGTYRSVSGEKASTASMTAVLGAFKSSAFLTGDAAARDAAFVDYFSLIPAGNFEMGDALDGLSGAPLHTVNVSAFYIGKTPVTYAEWMKVYNWSLANHYIFNSPYSIRKWGTDDYPVGDVSWYDAVKWCNAKSEMDGLIPVYYIDLQKMNVYRSGNIDLTNAMVKWSENGYRLPTESEWEKAARGGLTRQRFPWGNTISHSQANYFSAADCSYDISLTRGYYSKYRLTGSGHYTSPVKEFIPNGFGLYDVAGNVLQWCWDWYGDYEKITTDPKGPQVGQYVGQYRTSRGGEALAGAECGRCANRTPHRPAANDSSSYGFRLAKTFK